MSKRSEQALWSLLFALFFLLLRLETILVYSASLPDFFELLAFFAFYLSALRALSILVYNPSKFLSRIGWTTFALYLCINLIANHYEMLLGESPGIFALYFFSELKVLSGSILEKRLAWHVGIELFVAIIAISYCPALIKRFLQSNSVQATLLTLVHTITGTSISFSVILFLVLLTNSDSQTTLPPPFQQVAAIVKQAGSAQRQTLTSHHFRYYRNHIGHSINDTNYNSHYPLCKKEALPNPYIAKHKNIILIILESIDKELLTKMYHEQLLLPNMTKIAAQGLLFNNFFSAGKRSSEALPAILSGLPPQLDRNFLWEVPLKNIDSFPFVLKKHGFHTSYFHGGDLSFEQQQHFLDLLGIDEIFGLKLSEKKSLRSWGMLDGDTFDEMRAWLEEHQKNQPHQPFFSVIATLSTHHPFERPRTWKTQTPPSNYNEEFMESARYLDAELGRFFKWFKNSVLHDNTIIAIVGDHGRRPYLRREQNRPQNDAVPFILYGLPKQILENKKSFAYRIGSQYDIPSTLAHLIPLTANPCQQGTNLFAPDSKFPFERTLIALENDDRTLVNYYRDGSHYQFDINTSKTIKMGSFAKPRVKSQKHNSGIDFDKFTTVLLNLSSYLYSNNRFSPPLEEKKRTKAPVLSRPKKTFVFEFPLKGLVNEKTVEAESGLQVPLYVSQDGYSFIMDKKMLHKGTPKEDLSQLDFTSIQTAYPQIRLAKFSDLLNKLNKKQILLTEVFTTKNYHLSRNQAFHIAKEIKQSPHRANVIFSSRAITMAASAKEACECQNGWILENDLVNIESIIGAATNNDIDWIFSVEGTLSAKDIEELRRYGFKVGIKISVSDTNNPTIPSLDADMFMISQDTTG